jgi:hypothetical protein
MSKLLEIKYGKEHKKLANRNIPLYGSGGIMRYVDIIWERMAKTKEQIKTLENMRDMLYLNLLVGK